MNVRTLDDLRNLRGLGQFDRFSALCVTNGIIDILLADQQLDYVQPPDACRQMQRSVTPLSLDSIDIDVLVL